MNQSPTRTETNPPLKNRFIVEMSGRSKTDTNVDSKNDACGILSIKNRGKYIFKSALSLEKGNAKNDLYNFNRELESNFKDQDSSANIYTQEHSYIHNKKMAIFDKYAYDNNKYKPDRVGIHSMNKFSKKFDKKGKNGTLYKTTFFRNNQYILNPKVKYYPLEILKKYEKQVKEDEEFEKMQKNQQSFNEYVIDKPCETENNKFGYTTSYCNLMNKYGSSGVIFNNTTNSLYKALAMRAIERYHAYDQNKISDIKSIYKNMALTSSIYDLKNTNRGVAITQHDSSWLLKRTSRDKIPILFPPTTLHNKDYNNKSEVNRYDKISQELSKLKTLILTDDYSKRFDYIKQFLREKNIDLKYTNDINLENFYKFITSDYKIDPLISYKDTIIKALLIGDESEAKGYLTEANLTHIRETERESSNLENYSGCLLAEDKLRTVQSQKSQKSQQASPSPPKGKQHIIKPNLKGKDYARFLIPSKEKKELYIPLERQFSYGKYNKTKCRENIVKELEFQLDDVVKSDRSKRNPKIKPVNMENTMIVKRNTKGDIKGNNSNLSGDMGSGNNTCTEPKKSSRTAGQSSHGKDDSLDLRLGNFTGYKEEGSSTDRNFFNYHRKKNNIKDLNNRLYYNRVTGGDYVYNLYKRSGKMAEYVVLNRIKGQIAFDNVSNLYQ